MSALKMDSENVWYS